MTKAKIRRYAATPTQVTMGAAVQTVLIEFETVAPTKLVAFGALSVTTVPVNDPLTTAWLTSIQITINQSEVVVPAMTRQDYVNLVQNIESKEGDQLLGTGNMLYKQFNPPLPAGVKVQITLIVNTLALGTTTPAGSAILTPIALAFDSVFVPPARRLTYYAALSQFPNPAGVTANTDVEFNLGTFSRLEKMVCIISENPVATPVDTWLGTAELVQDGEVVNHANAPEMKKQYAIAADGIAVPAAWHALIFPEGGFQTAAQRQLLLRIRPYLTVATAAARGYEIYEKAF